MKLKYLPVVSCLLLALHVTANAFAHTSPKPEKCPSVSSIQSVGLHGAERSRYNGKWNATTLSPSQYDTENTWLFMLTDFDAQNADDALAHAKSSLTTLAFEYGPYEDKIASWVCTYVTTDSHLGLAISIL